MTKESDQERKAREEAEEVEALRRSIEQATGTPEEIEKNRRAREAERERALEPYMPKTGLGKIALISSVFATVGVVPLVRGIIIGYKEAKPGLGNKVDGILSGIARGAFLAPVLSMVEGMDDIRTFVKGVADKARKLLFKPTPSVDVQQKQRQHQNQHQNQQPQEQQKPKAQQKQVLIEKPGATPPVKPPVAPKGTGRSGGLG
jgi:hypothetical protein